MNQQRLRHAGTKLDEHQVMVIGGIHVDENGVGIPLKSVEVYDERSNRLTVRVTWDHEPAELVVNGVGR